MVDGSQMAMTRNEFWKKSQARWLKPDDMPVGDRNATLHSNELRASNAAAAALNSNAFTAPEVLPYLALMEAHIGKNVLPIHRAIDTWSTPAITLTASFLCFPVAINHIQLSSVTPSREGTFFRMAIKGSLHTIDDGEKKEPLPPPKHGKKCKIRRSNARFGGLRTTCKCHPIFVFSYFTRCHKVSTSHFRTRWHKTNTILVGIAAGLSSLEQAILIGLGRWLTLTPWWSFRPPVLNKTPTTKPRERLRI